MMRIIAFALAMAIPVTGAAQEIPDLIGTWTGTFKTLVYGTNAFHPGNEKATDPPRVREIAVTLEVEGQDGQLAWGKGWVGDGPKDPFAWAIGADGKTIVGSDADGSHFMTVVEPNRIERCYTHNGAGPSGSIVATCGVIERK
jgi:hypothetical protein